eukprot:6180899-Pleurochrysis_carterae.AAC.2
MECNTSSFGEHGQHRQGQALRTQDASVPVARSQDATFISVAVPCAAAPCADQPAAGAHASSYPRTLHGKRRSPGQLAPSGLNSGDLHQIESGAVSNNDLSANSKRRKALAFNASQQAGGAAEVADLPPPPPLICVGSAYHNNDELAAGNICQNDTG